MCCGLVLKIPCLAIAMYLFYRRTVFLKRSSLFHSQASRWYFLVFKGELVALTSLFQAWYNMIQSQPYSKDTPLILAILNSDFGWISLCYKEQLLLFVALHLHRKAKSHVPVIPYLEVNFDWFSKKPEHWNRVICLRVISFWFYLNVSFQNTSIPPPRMVNGISKGMGG